MLPCVYHADGEEMRLSNFANHVLLIVNVASNCGYTDVNYKELQVPDLV
jgi:glutathione peroxidase-family protein